METSRFRKQKAPEPEADATSTGQDTDPNEFAGRFEALRAELRAAEAHRRRLEQDVEKLKASSGAIDVAGQEVAAVLRAFAEAIDTTKTDSETRANAVLAEAEAAAREIREGAEEEAHRLRVAAQDAHDQGLQGLEVARMEARRMWEDARGNADAVVEVARSEAAAIVEQTRAAAAETHTNAEARAARVLGDSQAAAADVRRIAEQDAAKLRTDAQRVYDEGTSTLEGARLEARRLVDDARHRAESLAAETEARSAARVAAIFDSAREELQRVHEARIGALRALDLSEERVRDVARSLRSLELQVNLSSAELIETAAAGPSSTEPGSRVLQPPASTDAWEAEVPNIADSVSGGESSGATEPTDVSGPEPTGGGSEDFDDSGASSSGASPGAAGLPAPPLPPMPPLPPPLPLPLPMFSRSDDDIGDWGDSESGTDSDSGAGADEAG